MQASAVAAMAAHAVLAASLSSHPLLSPLPNLNPSNNPSLHSSFHGVSVKFPRQSLALSIAAASPKKPLAVVAATKKAVAVLKGTSNVEGIVTLTQEDDGLLHLFSVTSLTLFLLLSLMLIFAWVLSRCLSDEN